MRIFIVTNILHKEKYRCVAYKSHVPFFISFAPASRGDIRHLYSGRTAFFMPVRPASRGDIRQTWSEPRLDFVSAETKSRPSFFINFAPASRGDIRHLYSGRTAFFMPVRPASRGDIRQTWSEPRLDFVSAETKSRPAFFVSDGPASRGDFRSSGGPRGHQNGRAGGFFCPFEKPLAQFAFSKKKIFRSKKFLSPKIPPRGGTRGDLGAHFGD